MAVSFDCYELNDMLLSGSDKWLLLFNAKKRLSFTPRLPSTSFSSTSENSGRGVIRLNQSDRQSEDSPLPIAPVGLNGLTDLSKFIAGVIPQGL